MLSSNLAVSSSNETSFNAFSLTEFFEINNVFKLNLLHSSAQICPNSPEPTITMSKLSLLFTKINSLFNENALKEISFDEETARLLDSIGVYSKINDLINMPTYTDLVTTDSTIVQRSPVIKAKNSFPSLMTFIPGDLEEEMLKSCIEDPNIKVLDNFIISHFESGINSYSLKNANSTIKVEAPFLIC